MMRVMGLVGPREAMNSCVEAITRCLSHAALCPGCDGGLNHWNARHCCGASLSPSFFKYFCVLELYIFLVMMIRLQQFMAMETRQQENMYKYR